MPGNHLIQNRPVLLPSHRDFVFFLTFIRLLPSFRHFHRSSVPRSCPHPLALFSLRPNTERAKDVVAHPSNSHLVSILPQDGALALDIGFHVRSNSCDTLETLRRNDTDIILQGSSIGRVQCSFEIDLDTGVIMLYNRSNSQTTQVSGENAMPFEWGHPHRVIV
jgi:hypothetical protein